MHHAIAIQHTSWFQHTLNRKAKRIIKSQKGLWALNFIRPRNCRQKPAFVDITGADLLHDLHNLKQMFDRKQITSRNVGAQKIQGMLRKL